MGNLIFHLWFYYFCVPVYVKDVKNHNVTRVLHCRMYVDGHS